MLTASARARRSHTMQTCMRNVASSVCAGECKSSFFTSTSEHRVGAWAGLLRAMHHLSRPVLGDVRSHRERKQAHCAANQCARPRAAQERGPSSGTLAAGFKHSLRGDCAPCAAWWLRPMQSMPHVLPNAVLLPHATACCHATAPPSYSAVRITALVPCGTRSLGTAL